MERNLGIAVAPMFGSDADADAGTDENDCWVYLPGSGRVGSDWLTDMCKGSRHDAEERERESEGERN